MINLDYQRDHILYQISKIILNTSSKNMKHDNPTIYEKLKLLTSETTKVLGSTENKISGENLPYFQITEVV